MATIGDINLEEPSTITARLAAVQITRNSSVQNQEVMVLGSPNSTTSLALAEVLGSTPASTTVGLVVRTAGPLIVSQSTASDLQATVTPVAGSTWSVRPLQSSAADLQMTATPVAGSTWRTQPGSTLWASSAGFHFDSSGALQVTGATASTVVTIARMVGNSSAADFMPVRLVNSSGDGFVGTAVDYVHGSTLTASTVAGPTVMLRASSTIPPAVSTSDMFVQQWGTLNGAAIVAQVTSSGADITDSTARAIRVNVVAGGAGGGIVTQSTAGDLQATVTPVAGSTWRSQPGSTLWASSAGFHFDSSGALMMTDVNPSTGPYVISSIVGPVTVRSSAANALVSVYQSTITDLLATVQLRDSSGVGIVGSTGVVAIGANALSVRQGMGTLQSTTVQITSTHSTAVYALISSLAALRHKVYAYIVQSTHTVPSTLIFMSSLAIDRWPVMFGSGSSGVTGANLALSPPAWIFHADAANALNVRVEGGSSVTSTVVVRIGLSWFDEV